VIFPWYRVLLIALETHPPSCCVPEMSTTTVVAVHGEISWLWTGDGLVFVELLREGSGLLRELCFYTPLAFKAILNGINGISHVHLSLISRGCAVIKDDRAQLLSRSQIGPVHGDDVFCLL
jgi:hypothetical protein